MIRSCWITVFLLVIAVRVLVAQTVVYSTNFGAGCTPPAGWNITHGSGFTFTNAYPSSGYSNPNASGGCHLMANNSVAEYNEIIINVPISTIGFQSLVLIFGGYVDGFNPSPSLTMDWGTDGVNFPNEINFVDVENTDIWELITPFSLPAAAEGLPNLYIRISYLADGSGGFYAMDDFQITGSSSNTFYSKPSSPLNLLSSWGNNVDGSGTSPTTFTAPGQTFNIANSSTQTISANWRVSGAGSKVVIKSGTRFIVPAASTFSGIIDVENNATLDLQTINVPTLGALGNASSNIVFGGTSISDIPARSDYVNVTISGATKTITPGNITFSGTLTLRSILTCGNRTITFFGNIAGGAALRGSANSDIIIGGSGVFNPITVAGTAAQRTFRNFVLNRPSSLLRFVGNPIISSSFVLQSGNTHIETNTLTLQNSISGTGLLLSSITGTVVYGGASAQRIYPSNFYGNLVLSGASGKYLTGTTSVQNNLTINSGASLVHTLTSNLFLGRNLINNGSITHTAGFVVLNGSVNQTLNGNSQFFNLRIAKNQGGSVSLLNGITSIRGYLTINTLTGTNRLQTNGNLVLVSNATFTGSLIDLSSNAGSGGSVLGNVVVMRAHGGATNTTRIFGSPVSGATVFNIGQGTDNVLVYSEDGLPPYPRINNTFNGSFRRATLGGTNLTVARGYSIRKNVPGVLTFTGVVNNGPISITVTRSNDLPVNDRGWNMLSNPYPSPISWSSVDKGTTGAPNSGVSIWNGSTYVAAANIPAGVGFFTQVTASGVITFNNSNRITSGTVNNTIYREESNYSPWFYIYVSSVSGSAPTDAFAIAFDNEATLGYESAFDIQKPYVAAGPFMYQQIDDKELSLNVVPHTRTEIRIPFHIQLFTNGFYKLYPSSLFDWYPDYQIFLVDSTESGVLETNLRNVTEIPFEKKPTDSDTVKRFSILIRYEPQENSATSPDSTQAPDDPLEVVYTSPGVDFLHVLGYEVPVDEISLSTTQHADKKNKPSELSEIRISKGSIVVQFKNKEAGNSHILVANASGVVLFQKENVRSEGTFIIPSDSFARQLLIIKVSNNKENIVKKVYIDE